MHRNMFLFCSPSAIVPAIALAGTGSGPGIREGGGDLPLRVGSGGPEGSRQAGGAGAVGERRRSGKTGAG